MHETVGAGLYVGMEKLRERMVGGAEVNLAGVSVSVDPDGRALNPKLGVAVNSPGGASMSAGVRISKARSGDVASGSLSFSYISGAQVGWAVSPSGVRLTDVRVLVGFASKASVSGSVDVSVPKESQPPFDIRPARDATGTALPRISQ
jgi:hypothetical protein